MGVSLAWFCMRTAFLNGISAFAWEAGGQGSLYLSNHILYEML